MSKQNSILRVSAYLLRYKLLFGLTIGLAISSTLFLLAIPLAIEWIWETYIEPRELDKLWIGAAILVGCYFFKELFNSLRIRINNTLEQLVLIDLRSDLHRKLLDLPVSFYDKRKSGEIASRVEGDVENVERALLDGTEQGVVAVLSILGFTIMLFVKQPFLAFCVCLPLPILFLLGRNHSKVTRKNWKAVRESVGELNALLVEDIQGNRMIHSFALKNRERKRFKERANTVKRNSLKAMYRWAIYWPTTNFISNLGMISVVAVGGYLTITQPEQFTTGELFLFFVSTSLLYEPLGRLHMLNHLFATGKASGDRVFEILDHALEIEEPEKPKPFPQEHPHIRFEKVTFHYHERAAVLNELELELKPGEVTALVGHTGAGKSTVANLLMRYYDVSKGQVSICGTDVRDIGLEELRSNIGYVAQDPFLFEGSVRDNLSLAAPQASTDDIRKALADAQALAFVDRLPDGLDTNIGEKGIRLSQGEKQRLTIARVLLKNPPLLILDEATASVDTITEAQIQQALDGLMQNRTVLIIAHRLSTVRKANQIVVLKQGDILEKGSHEDLLAKSGHYAELWRRQADIVPEHA